MPGTALACLAFAACAGSRSPIPQQTELIVAATTDVHGRLRGWDYYTNALDSTHSLAAAATIVDSVRAANPGRVLLVDAGDLLQGNPLTFVAAKVAVPPVHPVIATMNAMQYDAAVLGNHEFNYGVPHLRQAVAQAAFPFLAANIRDRSGRSFMAPFTLVTRTLKDGSAVRIGIVGGTTPGSMVWDAENMKAAGLTVRDIVPAVRAAVEDARRQLADVVVVLLHSGFDEPASYDTVSTGLPSENVAARVAREVDGIDVIVVGHSHKEMIDSTVNGVLVMQPRNWAGSVAVGTVRLERLGGRWRVTGHHGASVRVAGHAESPAVLRASAVTHQATVAWATTPIGATAVAWRADSARLVDSPITDFVNEVMRREAGTQLSTTAVFSLDASLPAGPITVAALNRLYPYDNTLRAVRISGTQLRAYLEHSARYYRTLPARGHASGEVSERLTDPTIPGYNFDVVSGAEYTIDLRQPVGARITALSVQGRVVQASDTFTMALNNYRASGGGGFAMLVGAPVVYERDVDIRQLLIDEVQRTSAGGGILDPATYATRNWQIVPAVSGPTVPSGDVVRVIAFSDFHAALLPVEEADGQRRGGAVALSAAIGRAQRECTGQCASVVVHAGDLFTGTPASDWDAGRPTVAVLNRMGVVAGALGNHEFDFGQDTLQARLRELTHPLLAINVQNARGVRPNYLRADTIVTVRGKRIGIVGAAGQHTPSSTKRGNVTSLQFLDPAPLMSARIRALRAAGAQVVVGVIHDGGRCDSATPPACSGDGIAVAQRLSERPDLFVIGHSHVNLGITVNGFPVVEPASSGRAIQVVDIPLDGRDPVVSLREVNGADTVGADPAVDSIVRRALEKVRPRIEQPVGTVATFMSRRGNQNAVGNLIADAMRVVGRSDVGIMNNGGIRADLQGGLLTFGGLHAILPFGNTLVQWRMRGSALRAELEQWLKGNGPDMHVSGLIVEYDSRRAAGSRIVALTTSAGIPVRDTGSYTVVINDFMADMPAVDGQRRPRALAERRLPLRDIDAVATYVAGHQQPFRADTIVRIKDRATPKSPTPPSPILR